MDPEPLLASPSASGTMLEGTVPPGPNSVELLRTAAADYRLRFSGKDPHVAELFQENTKLSPHTTVYDPAAAAGIDQARAWHLTTAYRARDDHMVAEEAHAVRLPVDTLPPRLGRMLEPFTQDGRLSSLLYCLDLYVLHEQALLRVVPRTRFLWQDRRIADGGESRVRDSMVSAEPVPSTGPLLFLVAAPWRYMLFLGPRGYRRMLMDAGELLGRLRDVAADAAVEAAAFLDFYDRQVDDVLQLDGTERTVIATVALDGVQS